MAKKKGKGGGRRRMNAWNIADRIADVNAGLQLGAPVVQEALGPLMAGDYAGALDAARRGAKQAVAFQNLLEAFGPKIGVAVAKKTVSVVRGFGR